MKKCPCGGNVPENRNEWQALKSSGFGACYCSKSEQYFLQYENGGFAIKVESGPPRPHNLKDIVPFWPWGHKTGDEELLLGDFVWCDSESKWEPVRALAGASANAVDWAVTHPDCLNWSYGYNLRQSEEWCWHQEKGLWIRVSSVVDGVYPWIYAKRRKGV